ncbi:hypothetical protein [Glutamicibacter creatinolyticus]|uniref:hypothetical protein n=1 Tax=Glutamicibacter creatinolyticus TaxID=162496 RepID=UPI00321751C6
MTTELTGQPVIHYSGDRAYVYEGAHNVPGVVGTRWGLANPGGLPAIRCDYAAVAPVGVKRLTKNDGRLEITKLDASALAHGKRDRPWRARIGDGWEERFKLKREALEVGLRRLSIMDWHEARETVRTLIAEGAWSPGE